MFSFKLCIFPNKNSIAKVAGLIVMFCFYILFNVCKIIVPIVPSGASCIAYSVITLLM